MPVFDTMADAVAQTGANASCIFVPAPFAPDAMLEAADAGLPLVICITEGVPGAGHAARLPRPEGARASRLIGPNCPGATTAGQAKVGIIPGSIHRPGSVGLVSRSGTLTYEVVQAMTDAGIGQSTCVGIGGDPIVGTSFIDVLDMFNRDPETEAIVMIGEIGGEDEERAAAFVQRETCASRWRPSSPAAPLRLDGAWGTPARSSPAARAPPSRSGRRSRQPASGWPTPRRTSPPCCATRASASPAAPAAASPLVGQDRHQHRILQAIRAAPRLAHHALALEAELLVRADRARVDA